ncbi:MAG: glycosyltransferase family 2 protein [Pirellulales bacterium]
MKRSTISAAIITLNEERNLPQLLQRLDWADEIIVVDGGSRDATIEIARDRASAVVVRKFDSFAEQRNLALRMSNCDWVLSVDADERPTRALAEEVRGRIEHAREAAFRVPIRSSIFGRRVRFSGTQGDRPVRLFRRSAGNWSGDVHERLRIDGQIGTLRHWLEHETLPDLASFLAKMNRYTTLAARERVAASLPPRRRDAWLSPAREVFRRLIWKHGLLDGPEGWAFCLLSGLSEWVLWHKHRQLWRDADVSFQPGTGPAGQQTAAGVIPPPHFSS